MKKIFNVIAANKWLLLILLAASLLRFHRLDFQSLWMDEIYTLNVANPSQSFNWMINEVTFREGFPYIYFILMKTLLSIFGYTAIVIRSFSAIMGILSVFMIYRLGTTLHSKKVGLIAASLLCFSEYSITISQDGRPYSLYLFAVLLSYNAMLIFIKRPILKNAVIYGLCAALLLNSNFFSIVNLFSQAIIVLFFIVISPNTSRFAFFKSALIAGLIAIIFFLPNFPILIKLLGFDSGWIPAPVPNSMEMIFRELLGNSEMTLFIFIPLFFYFLFTIFKIKESFAYQSIIDNRRLLSFLILTIWAGALIMIIFVRSYVGSSMMISRYFTSLLGVFFLVFAFGIYFIKNRIVRFTVLGSLLFLMLANHVVVRQYYRVPSKTQFREATLFVLKNNKSNVDTYTSLKYWFDYYFNDQKAANLLQEVPSINALIDTMKSDPEKLRPFFYIDAHHRPITLTPESEEFVNEHFYLANSFDGLDAWGRYYLLKSDRKPVPELKVIRENVSKKGLDIGSSIEKVEVSDQKVTVSGWAILMGVPSEGSTINILLVKDEAVTEMNIKQSQRLDVTSFYKSKVNLNNSGFEASIDLTKIEKGRYQLAIYIVNDQLKKEGLLLTDRFVTN